MIKRSVSEHAVKVEEGRILLAEVSGAPAGTPVFLLHGTPGSRVGPKPRFSVLYRHGVRLISYDRPGYGGSGRHEGRSVADAAKDVAAIADHLGIEEFAVVGRSGGGPHALACAAVLGARVKAVAALVSLAPADVPDLVWFEGMNGGNVSEYRTADSDWPKESERIRLLAHRTQRNPDSLVDSIRSASTAPDRRMVNDVALRKMLLATYSEAVKSGPYGWIDDVRALRADWAFSLEAIQSKVLLWHGAQDNFSPVRHTRWLATQIPGAIIKVQAATEHFGAVEAPTKMFARPTKR